MPIFQRPCFQVPCPDGLQCLLLCPVEEREGEDRDGGNRCQAPAAWESSRRKISVFVMSLLQNISFRDKALLLGMMGRALL